MRTPIQPPPDVIKRVDNSLITQTRRYKVITPLFGGGVVPGQADPVTVVRATEVRGHLRFWWRATNAGRFRTIADLKTEEERLWGSTEEPSRILVDIPIEYVNKGTPEIAFRVMHENGKVKVKTIPSFKIAPYAAFPLLPDKDEQKQPGWQSKSVRVDVSFVLNIEYPGDIKTDVESALWGWETFGGIGARTRRGFGALQWLDETDRIPEHSSLLNGYLQSKLSQMTRSVSDLTTFPSISQQLTRYKFTKPFNSPIEAWQDIISAFYEFRQARYGKKFGLSKWPEANEIRRLFNLNARLPEGESTTRLVPKFPRAAFGLPIIFHMPHDPSVPNDLILDGLPDERLGREYDRLASPLILRPLACAGGKYVGLAAILHAPTQPPQGLRLKGAPGDPHVKSKLCQSEARQIEPLEGKTDVLQAFLDWL